MPSFRRLAIYIIAVILPLLGVLMGVLVVEWLYGRL